MVASACPDREQLSGYVLGTLPEESFEAVAEHVESCPGCEATVVDLETQPDLVIQQLRTAPPTDSFLAEPGYREVLAMIQQMGQVAAATPSAEESPVLGTIRVYRLLEKLGDGGMGTVYKALHTELEKVVALKVVASGRLNDPRAVSRFKREMKAVGKLEHPHIVRAFDAGEDAGRHYLVMEYVPGCDVGRLVERLGPLPVADACEIIRQAALGLQHAHEHGLVHRDIKPSNLIVATSGAPADLSPRSDAVVKVADFGLARLAGRTAEAGSELTGEGQVMGTLDYMAPEQGGDTRGVDIRADLYGLGATLYKLLCGEAPFSGRKYATAMQKIRALAVEAVPPIEPRRSAVAAGPLSDGLAALVHRLLDKNPARRPATPQQVAEALAPFCTGSDLAGLVRRANVGAAALPSQTAPGAAKPPRLPASSISTMDQPAAGSLTEDQVPTSEPQVDQPRAAGSVAPEPTGVVATEIHPAARSSKKWHFWVAAAVLLLALLPLGYYFGGAVLRIATNRGQLIIEVDDPRVEVTVKENGAVIQDRPGQREITLAAGEHDIEVTIHDAAGETHFFTRKLTLKRGGKEIVNVRQELAAKAGEPREKPVPPPQARDADRKAAEWVLSIGGTIQIR
jgi:serine/threonine protein kinase